MILLHGGFGVINMFGPLLSTLAATRQVIGVELQGHGHTVDIDRPFSFESIADDIAALLEHLGLEKADILGYSLGGGVTLQTTIRHPGRVRKLVVVSAVVRSADWYPEVRAGMKSITAEIARTWTESPMYQAYINASPDPEGWLILADKTGNLLRQEYDWSAEVARVTVPVLFVVGDADSIAPAQAVEYFGLLGGGKADAGWDGSGMSNSRLAILPATTHYNILASPLLAPIITAFLDA